MGICPLTRCAKRLLNGPCGGSRDGICEVNPDLECAWQLIYDRARALGALDQLAVIAEPQDLAAAVSERWGGLVTRLSFYTPYQNDPDTWLPVVEALKAA